MRLGYSMVDSERSVHVIESAGQIILKNNITHDIAVIRREIEEGQSDPQKFEAFGLYGAIEMKRFIYLVFVTGAIAVGSIRGQTVYEIKDVAIIKCRHSTPSGHHGGKGNILEGLFSETVREIILIRRFFDLPGNYFSKHPIYESKFDTHCTCFLFNKAPLEQAERLGEGLEPFTLKCIQGSFVSFNIDDLNIMLLSMRSRHRAGVRYFSRGADSCGYVSNFVETTQTISNGDHFTAHVQIRGSIPLSWKHTLNLKYRPNYTINSQSDAFTKTDNLLIKRYGKIFYLNLIKDIKYEGDLFREFSRCLDKHSKEYTHFDFDAEGLGYNENARKKFKNRILPYVDKFGIFHSKLSGSQKFANQVGVIRTNCIDSLDRTNVSQFLIGKIALEKQLSILNMKIKNEIDERFREMWFINGNVLSIQYSGTPSVKSHLIIPNENAKTDIIKNFLLSCKRYLINRLDHGILQDSYGLITSGGVKSLLKESDEENL